MVAGNMADASSWMELILLCDRFCMDGRLLHRETFLDSNGQTVCKPKEYLMNKLKRLIWCALLFGIQALYFPLNKYLQGGVEFKTSLDAYIPLRPIWEIPYGMVCGWWVIAYLWAAWRMDEDTYDAFFLASAVMQV